MALLTVAARSLVGPPDNFGELAVFSCGVFPMTVFSFGVFSLTVLYVQLGLSLVVHVFDGNLKFVRPATMHLAVDAEVDALNKEPAQCLFIATAVSS